MIDERAMRQIVQRIVAMTRPRRVILFGSNGRGDAREDSEIDIILKKLPDSMMSQRRDDGLGCGDGGPCTPQNDTTARSSILPSSKTMPRPGRSGNLIAPFSGQ